MVLHPTADLLDGAHSFTVVATDTTTNVSSAASAPLVLTVDPSPPAISALAGAAGAHAAGDTVGDTALVLAGAADPGNVVTVSDGTTVLGQATLSGSVWTFALPAGLAFGPHSLTAVATDPSDSAVSAQSGPFAFTLAPPAPVVSGLSAQTDTGASSTDGITSNADPTIVGTAVAGDLVSVFDGTTLIGAAQADGTGAWQLTPAAAFAYGPHAITATDQAANGAAVSASSASNTVVVLPAPPSVDGFMDGGGLTSGSGSTLDRRPQIDGATPAGTTVQVFANGALLGDAVVSGTAWTYDPPADLPETSYILTAVATDPGTGVASEASAPLTLAVALAPPVADGFTDAAGFMAGGATLDHRPALSGTNPDGAAVSVYDGGALVGSASVAGATWSFTPTADLLDGAHSFTVVATDTTTNVSSAASAPLVLTVDPSPPAISALAGAAGAHAAGDTVGDTALVLAGAADPGNVVTVSDGTTVLGQATLSGSVWTFALPAGLAFGPHSLTAVATDPSDSAVSAQSGPFAFTLAPPAPVVSGLSAQTDTGASSTDGITSNADPTIVGTAVAGDLVSVFDGTTLIGAAQADGTGAWQLTPAAAFAYGPHAITATDQAANGAAVSASSASNTVVVLSQPPLIMTLDGSGTGQPLTGRVSPDARPTLSGTGLAGTAVSIYDGAALIGQSGTIGADGSWSATTSRSLAAGLHVLTAVASDAAGDLSERSATLSLVVNPPPGAAGPGSDPFAAAIRTSIATLLGTGSGGDNALIYPQAGEASPVMRTGSVAGLSIDDSMSGQSVQVPQGTEFVSDIATGPVTVVGAADGPQVAVSTGGDLTYVAGSGSGVLLADGTTGRAVLFGSSAASSAFIAATGAGDDVFVLQNGDVSLSGGAGANQFWLGAARSVIHSAGVDTIVAGAGGTTVMGGTDTVAAAGSHSDLLFGGSGDLEFINIAGSATVVGGAGRSTLLGGSGSDLFFGGRAGANVIVGGTAPSTLFGGGDGDLLYAQGGGDTTLVARGDNATLAGGASTGNNLYFGSSGRNVIAAGKGNDTVGGGTGHSTVFAGSGHDLVFGADGGGDIIAGSGNATLVGGKGPELYAFFDGRAGGDVKIYNFRPGADHLTLKGYDETSIHASIANQTLQNGSAHLVLADGTRITFVGVSAFKADNLV